MHLTGLSSHRGQNKKYKSNDDKENGKQEKKYKG
jgi:hypothetical protein